MRVQKKESTDLELCVLTFCDPPFDAHSEIRPLKQQDPMTETPSWTKDPDMSRTLLPRAVSLLSQPDCKKLGFRADIAFV